MTNSPENIARICIDVVMAILVLISAIRGWRKGLAAVILSCFRWLICIAVALIGAFPFSKILTENTGIKALVENRISSTLSSPTKGGSFFMALPEQLRGLVTEYQQSAALKMTDNLTSTFISVISFLIIFLASMIVIKLLIFALSKKDKDDAIGIINGFFGACMGLIRGGFVVCLVMLALFPLLTFLDPNATSPIVAGIRESYVANLLYDHNPITMVFDMF